MSSKSVIFAELKAYMNITSQHIEPLDMSQDQQTSVKPLQDGRKMASGILSDSDSSAR